jgi:pancreatic triacylglycerol lipase
MIGVDWSIGGNTINYVTARNRVGAVASVIARFIDNLNEINFLEFKDVHVIGHSLGGQIAGLTGKAVTRGTVQVVMACDPAGPLFSLNNPEGRVAPTDAVHVEV